jgi:hypothetical protein
MDGDGVAATAGSASGRDGFIDLVRGASLVVVCVWHWAFTILVWGPDGPSPTNPIGFTSGLWLLTWVLQVMPLFFFAGGWANLSAWRSAQARGVTMAVFMTKRARQLVTPALALVAVWWGIGIAVGAVYGGGPWLTKTVILVLSPLWFLITYLAIFALLPLWVWLHRRFDVLAPVCLAGVAVLVDVARFAHDLEWVGWLNMVVVWGLAHQLGFFYDRMVRWDRHQALAVTLGGLFGLMGLVWAGLYPASMVGVPGDKFSNMAPPSLAIVCLCVLQVGALMLLRPWVLARMERRRWVWFRETLSTYSLPLYLLHSTGMAAALFVAYLVTGQRVDSMGISGWWWLTRPLAVAVPLLFTLPLLWLYGRLERAKR